MAGPALAYAFRTGHGEFRGSLASPAARIRLATLARLALRFTDRWLAFALPHALPGGASISCAKGCTACCHQAVPVSPPEALLIAEVVRGGGRARSNPPLPTARFESVAARVASLGDLPVFSGVGPWRALGIVCPCLEEDACTIHEDRPGACRSHLATSAPACCSDPGGFGLALVPVTLRIEEALAATAARLTGVAPSLAPLHGALRAAHGWRALDRRTFDAVGVWSLLMETVAGREGWVQIQPPASIRR